MSVNESTYIPLKRMYRAREMAEILGIGTSTLWRYAQQGKIKSYRISSGVTVFSLDEVYKDLGLEVNL